MKLIIEAIEKELASKNNEIICKSIEIEQLQKKLVAAEKEIADLKSEKELEESAAGNFERRCAE